MKIMKKMIIWAWNNEEIIIMKIMKKNKRKIKKMK